MNQKHAEFLLKLKRYKENPRSVAAMLAAYSAANSLKERRMIPLLSI
jgi:hypothetical protein